MRLHSVRRILPITVLGMTLFLSAACTTTDNDVEETADTNATSDLADLAAIKAYAVERADLMRPATADLRQAAEEYYELLEAAQFGYGAVWQTQSAEALRLVTDARAAWVEASQYYEQNEGIVAGVPSLADFDVWLDAGPSGEEDPEEARDWSLTLPSGTVLERPGNFFHSLLEPALWGTTPEATGLAVDLDGNGTIVAGEALPEANRLVAAARGLDDATAEMQTAIADWEPTLSDSFTALVTMIPTMNEYFEQWKSSVFVSGDATEAASFIGVSRLFDILGILQGLEVTYDNLSPLTAQDNAALDTQIKTGFADLISYVRDLYEQEQAGTSFTPEQAEIYGTEAQEKALALVGQVSQAAGLLDIEIQE